MNTTILATMEDEFHDDIARIEMRIEELAASIERCRKISTAAKVTIAAGAIWLALTLVWIVPFVAYALVAAMAAVIGGIVLLGSNASTWAKDEDALAKAERLRAELIGRIELRVVGEPRPTLH